VNGKIIVKKDSPETLSKRMDETYWKAPVPEGSLETGKRSVILILRDSGGMTLPFVFPLFFLWTIKKIPLYYTEEE
jgi:hypothetical protein